jgi:hypothetical protein
MASIETLRRVMVEFAVEYHKGILQLFHKQGRVSIGLENKVRRLHAEVWSQDPIRDDRIRVALGMTPGGDRYEALLQLFVDEGFFMPRPPEAGCGGGAAAAADLDRWNKEYVYLKEVFKAYLQRTQERPPAAVAAMDPPVAVLPMAPGEHCAQEANIMAWAKLRFRDAVPNPERDMGKMMSMTLMLLACTTGEMRLPPDTSKREVQHALLKMHNPDVSVQVSWEAFVLLCKRLGLLIYASPVELLRIYAQRVCVSLVPVYTRFVKLDVRASLLKVAKERRWSVLHDRLQQAAWQDLSNFARRRPVMRTFCQDCDVERLYHRSTPVMVRFAFLIKIMVQLGVWDVNLFPNSTSTGFDLFLWSLGNGSMEERPRVDYESDVGFYLDEAWVPVSQLYSWGRTVLGSET